MLSKSRSKAYHAGMYQDVWPLGFAGRSPKNEPLPAGAYTLRFKVWDLAGNPGRAKSITVHVWDEVLVEARGTVIVPPSGVTTPSTPPASPTSARDGARRPPVATTRRASRAARSYRPRGTPSPVRRAIARPTRAATPGPAQPLQP